MNITNVRIVGKQVPGVGRTVFGEWFVKLNDKKRMNSIRTELTLTRALEPEAGAGIQTRGTDSDWHDFQF
jgi:hypothetical protein